MAVAIFGSVIVAAAEQPCPPQPLRPHVIVHATVTQDSDSKLYTYRYRLNRYPKDSLPVYEWHLDLLDGIPVMGVSSPKGWIRAVPSSTTGWTLGPLKDKSVIQGSQPGTDSEVGEFSLGSPVPPGTVRYYISGGDPSIANQEHDDSDDCVYGWQQNGTTLGPTNFFTIPVAIQPTMGMPTIDVQRKTPVVVVLFSTKRFSAVNIDPNSVRLGNSLAKATSNHLVDFDRDGIPDLLLEFPVTEDMFSCNEKSVSVIANSKQGPYLWGSDFVTVTGCKRSEEKASK